MRKSIAALALIRREQDGQTLYLAQWHLGWLYYHFVGGHKHADESFRECAIREMTEELDLVPGTEFTVAPEPLCHLEYNAWSESAQEETGYTMELFEVTLTDEARQKVDADPQNRWVTDGEIRSRKCNEGMPVSETMVRLLTTIGCIVEISRP